MPELSFDSFRKTFAFVLISLFLTFSSESIGHQSKPSDSIKVSKDFNSRIVQKSTGEIKENADIGPRQGLSEFERILYTALASAIISVIVSALTFFSSIKSKERELKIVFNSKVEEIKLSFESKSKEIKLMNYHKDRIDAVKKIYSLVVELQGKHYNLLKLDNSEWTYSNYLDLLNNWLNYYFKVNNFYSLNRILLLEDTDNSRKIRTDIASLFALKNIISKELGDVNEFDRMIGGDYASAFNNDPNEEYEAVRKDSNRIRNDDTISKFSFDDVRRNLENYFKELIL